jgi:N6-L-threonylcarbamoyladenine synthase
MRVLGIETTCDETACAIVENGKTILSNVVSSQVDLHKHFGGVIPELACRRHIDVIIPVIQKALNEAHLTLKEIDLLAVANGPGLIGALLIGVNTAKALSLALKIPLVGVNHVEAHLFAALMDKEPIFPSLGVVLSGGHTFLARMEGLGDYRLISETIDDALGEAFDKVARILSLPYPGGPEIEALAKKGNPNAFDFTPGFVKNRPLHFSFSGLKTAVLYKAKGQNLSEETCFLTDQMKADLAASFQKTAFLDVLKKAKKVFEMEQCQSFCFGGGVTNNKALRELFQKECPDVPQYWPEFELSLDNAAMIGGLGYYVYKTKGESKNLQAQTRISF